MCLPNLPKRWIKLPASAASKTKKLIWKSTPTSIVDVPKSKSASTTDFDFSVSPVNPVFSRTCNPRGSKSALNLGSNFFTAAIELRIIAPLLPG